jgi:hypothetical protein
MKFSPNAVIRALPGWMNYMVRLPDGTERKVIFRNHNSAHIRHKGRYAPVFFDTYEAECGEAPCEVSWA